MTDLILVPLTLAPHLAAAIEDRAARVGMSSATWIADRLAETYSLGQLPPRRIRTRSPDRLRRWAAYLLRRAEAISAAQRAERAAEAARDYRQEPA